MKCELHTCNANPHIESFRVILNLEPGSHRPNPLHKKIRNTNSNKMFAVARRYIANRLTPHIIRDYLALRAVGLHGSVTLGREASEVDDAGMLRSEGFAYNAFEKRSESLSTNLPQQWYPSNEMLDYAHSLVHEADNHAKECELGQALDLYLSAVEVMKKYPDMTLELARIQNKIGVLHFKEDRFDDALLSFQQALSILDESEVSRGVVLKNIAEIYRKEGNIDKALKFYQDAIGFFRDSPSDQVSGSNSSTQFDDVYSNICLVYREKEYINEADSDDIPTSQRDIGTERQNSDHHTSPSDDLHHLAVVRFRRGDYEEALQLLNESLAMKQMMKGYEGYSLLSTAKTLHYIGKVHLKRADYAEALKALTEALEIRRNEFGMENIDTAETLRNIGVVNYKLGNYVKAMDDFEEVYRILSNNSEIGEDHQDVAIVLTNIGNVHAKLGQHHEAMRVYHRSLDLKRKLFGSDHPDILDTLSNIGVIQIITGQFEAALDTFSEVLTLQQKWQVSKRYHYFHHIAIIKFSCDLMFLVTFRVMSIQMLRQLTIILETH